MTSPSHKPSRAEKGTMRSDILSVVNMLSYRLNLRLLFLWSIQHQQKAFFRLVPVPGHGAQISARAPTKGYIQTGTHALARCPN